MLFRSIWVIAGFILLMLLGILIFRSLRPARPLPNPVRQEYQYYRIVDQANGERLMDISSVPVTKGDELITRDNRRYVVVRVEKNIAYAKFLGKEKLPGRTDIPRGFIEYFKK